MASSKRSKSRRLELEYAALRHKGQSQQLADVEGLDIEAWARKLAVSFAETVRAFEKFSREEIGGTFHPGDHSRKPLTREDADKLTTFGVTAKLKLAGTVTVQGRSFKYVDRELIPSRVFIDRKARYLPLGAPELRKVRTDLLLADAKDKTPIVGELKVAGDQNALFALIQVLATAAQLSVPTQLARLNEAYPNAFPSIPKRLDAFVITRRPPENGKRPKLALKAHELADAIREQGEIATWVRKIEFVNLDTAAAFRS